MANQSSAHQSRNDIVATSDSAISRSPDKSQTTDPTICIIVPVLNEEKYIEACLTSLLRQNSCNIVDLIVTDGGSTDNTVALVRNFVQRHSVVRLLHNPRRIQAAGINLAAKEANPRADVLVRADAHVTYQPDFVAKCASALRGNGATSVVVPMRTVSKGGFQRAVAAAQNRRLGNGGAAHRSVGRRSGFVDHGHHAAFDRSFFHRCLGYDESFSHNEDAELDCRALRAGGRIWMCAEACVAYFPRSTPFALGRQYLRNGRGRARTLIKHGMRPRLRQLAPVFLLLLVIGGLSLSAFSWAFALLPLMYFALCLGLGLVEAIPRSDPWLLAMGPAAVIMHMSFAIGFLQTMLQFYIQRLDKYGLVLNTRTVRRRDDRTARRIRARARGVTTEADTRSVRSVRNGATQTGRQAGMKLAYLDESQNEAFDYEYHSEVELEGKLTLIRDVFPNGPGRILDIGGGNGKFLDRLLAEFPKSDGYLVDISRNLLDANQPNPRKRLIHGSFECLADLLPGKTFDLVTMNWVLHHLVGSSYRESVENVQQALALTSRTLSADGLILVAENEYQGLLESNIPSHIIYRITSVRNPGFARIARRYFNTAGVGVCFQSKRSWFKIFERSGLKVEYYQQHSRWRHGLKKRLMFLALFLRTQRHGHFGLRQRTGRTSAIR